MKIFISWSGEVSRQIAVQLSQWFPVVLHYAEPFISDDLEKGLRWSSEIASALENTSFGIVCLTPDNIHAPWIHFESGAIAKIVDESRLSPLLLGLKKSDVNFPLAQFQLTDFTKDDFHKLIKSINSFSDANRIDDFILDKLFSKFWDDISNPINAILSDPRHKGAYTQKQAVDPKKNSEVLEEILSLVREQAKYNIGEISSQYKEISHAISYLSHTIRDGAFPKDHPAWEHILACATNLRRMLPTEETPTIPPHLILDLRSMIDAVFHLNRYFSPKGRRPRPSYVAQMNLDGNSSLVPQEKRDT